MKTCFELKSDSQYDIALQQSESGQEMFTVTYGLQVKKGLTYSEAAKELGAAIMHAAACDGKLNNRCGR